MSLGLDIPKIAITPEDDDDHNFLNLAEAMTDCEEIYENEAEKKSHLRPKKKKHKLKIILTEKGCATDLEDFEASDNEENDVENIRMHQVPIVLDDLDLENGTVEESYKTHVRGVEEKNKLITQISTTQNNKYENWELKTFRENLTDIEEITTDNEFHYEEIKSVRFDLDLYTNNQIDVSETLDTSYITNDEKYLQDSNRFKKKNIPAFNNVQSSDLLSLTSNLSDLTGTEVLNSDTDDEGNIKKTKHRKRRTKGGRRQSAAEIRNIEISQESCKLKPYGKKSKPIRVNKTKLSLSSQSLPYDYSDNEDNTDLSFPLCKKVAHKKNYMLEIPHIDLNLLTDNEDIEGLLENELFYKDDQDTIDAAFEQKLNDMAICYQTNEALTLLDGKTDYVTELQNIENVTLDEQTDTDIEHYETDNTDDNNESKLFDSAYNIYFANKNDFAGNKKKNKAKILTGEHNETDSEPIDSSSDEELLLNMPLAFIKQSESFTDEEIFEEDGTDTTLNVPDIILPPPNRNLVILRENDLLPNVQILPIDEDEDSLEKCNEEILEQITDEENISEVGDVLEVNLPTSRACTPDLHMFDNDLICVTENLMNKTTQKLPSIENDSITDTEEVIMEKRGKRQRAPKFKYMYEMEQAYKNRLGVTRPSKVFTDTEDLYLSDASMENNFTSLLVRQNSDGGVTDIETLGDMSEDEQNPSNVMYLKGGGCIEQPISSHLFGHYFLFNKYETCYDGSTLFSTKEAWDATRKPVEQKPATAVTEKDAGGEAISPTIQESSEEAREGVESTSSTKQKTAAEVKEDPEPTSSTKQRTATETRAPVTRRRPLRYEISIEDQTEVDPREHDWRFNLPKHAEGEESPHTEDIGGERNFPDQHQLSDEMRELLKELEKESKQ